MIFYWTLFLKDTRLHGILYCMFLVGVHCGRALVCLVSFSFIFLSCAGRFGRTGEPGEDIVDVTVGRLAHGCALQYLARGPCGGMAALPSPASSVSL